MAPAAKTPGEISRSESTAEKLVSTVDFRRNDQSKEVILLPCATWRPPPPLLVGAIVDGESRPFNWRMRDLRRSKASNWDGFERESMRKGSIP